MASNRLLERKLKMQDKVRWQLHKAPNGVQYYAFDSLNDKKVCSLFTTRNGGVSIGCYESLNMGCSTGDSKENVLENCKLVAECMGTSADRMVTAAQTHTKNIRIVTEADAGKGVTVDRDYCDIDGLITDVKGLCLFTGHADCNPVLIYDPVKEVIGAIHSGWMGTLLNISAEAVNLMKNQFGSNLSDLKVGIGPALCRDCFEVDRDVAEKFMEAYPYLKPITIGGSENPKYPGKDILIYQKGIKYYIDLKGIIVHELTALGVKANQIEVSELCTKEHPELFHSHRRTGMERGVMASAIMLK